MGERRRRGKLGERGPGLRQGDAHPSLLRGSSTIARCHWAALLTLRSFTTLVTPRGEARNAASQASVAAPPHSQPPYVPGLSTTVPWRAASVGTQAYTNSTPSARSRCTRGRDSRLGSERGVARLSPCQRAGRPAWRRRASPGYDTVRCYRAHAEDDPAIGQPIEPRKLGRRAAEDAAETAQRKLNPGLEPKTVVNTHRILHRAWEDFATWGWAKRNFVSHAHPPRVPRKGRKV
jgi:hypothetical protein